MLSSAPGDATLASLLVGVGVGVSFALLSLLALTHTPAQWAAYVAWICTHGWRVAQAGIAVALLSLLVRVAVWRLSAHAVLPPAERLAARRRNLAHLPAHFPNGWVRLCDSADARMGATQHIRLCGLDVALYRALGESPSLSGRGRVFALDAVCPHLGANMGAGGKVVGNALECPFHGWQFAGKDGVCQSIPYASKIPSNAKVATWSVTQHDTAQHSAVQCSTAMQSGKFNDSYPNGTRHVLRWLLDSGGLDGESLAEALPSLHQSSDGQKFVCLIRMGQFVQHIARVRI